MTSNDQKRNKKYWHKNLQVVGVLLSLWFLVSFGCSILWVDALDRIQVGHIKLGFWFAQQGSIYAFTLIIFVYVIWMNRLEDRSFETEPHDKEGGAQ